MPFSLLIVFSYFILTPNWNYTKLYKNYEFRIIDNNEKLQALLKCNNRSLRMELLQHGDYWVVLNFIRGTISAKVSCAETITYTTHGDFKFLAQLPTLVERWRAPISMAIYTPGTDLNTTLYGIQYLRECHASRSLIRQYLTIHLYFPNTHIPAVVPLNESTAWEQTDDYDCSQQSLYFEQLNDAPVYRHNKQLSYPINVGRNIARKAANTHFILASDIELFPSPGLVQQFLELVISKPNAIIGGNGKRVFPLPVFEVEKNASLPTTKTELAQMLLAKRAITFHYHICKTCHLVPNYLQWLNATDTQTLSVFTIAKRVHEFNHWEPFYISDNAEPLFDERIQWEGLSDKRIQNYAICLLDYEYHVLHPAFLVHAPGIKYARKPNTQTKRKNYVGFTNYLIKTVIKPEYEILYGNNSLCGV